MKNRQNGIHALWILLPMLLMWELIVTLADIPVYILPAPSRILISLITRFPAFLEAALITTGEALAGLVLGFLAGTAAALGLGIWPRLERSIMTIAIFIKSTPIVAVAPLLTIWFGFGTLPKIIITALMTFFPVLINVFSGLHAADPALLDVFHSWKASRREILLYVRIPAAAPYVFAALKVSGPLAFIGAVVAEWTGASGGLGRTMWMAYTNLNLPILFAAVSLLACSGMLLFSGLTLLEKRLVFWMHPEI
ncbi:MAG: ABC transporter permease [Anaerolineales bacterium]|nr:ABC transporter permease [Anaerolineales bacterium]